MKTLSVIEYSEFPGPRFERLGPHSGEGFRDRVLIPAIKEHGDQIIINLDGPIGYGSSFLEEAFGGLIRADVSPQTVENICNNIISNDDPSLIDEIRSYVQDAITLRHAS